MNKKLIIISLIVLVILIIPFPVVREEGINLNGPLIKKIISITTYNQFPKYGYAPDFSWVSGKLEYYNLEGGCGTIIFSEDANAPYHGGFAIDNKQFHKFKLRANTFVTIKGRLGENRFSMSCQPQHYIIDEVL